MGNQARSRFAETFRLGGSMASLAAGAGRKQRYVRLARALSLLVLMLAVGTYGYWRFTDGARAALECLYMTVITITTVGFYEVVPVDTDALRVFTMLMIFVGGAIVAYVLTAMAAVIIEGDLFYSVWQRRLSRKIGGLHDHIVVCGLGLTGRRTHAQLRAHGVQVVGIDQAPERVTALVEEHGSTADTLFVVGDCFSDEVLLAARLDQARGLVAALTDDRDNLLLCVTARQLNPDLEIVLRMADPDNASLLHDIAAAKQVDPAVGGAVRMVQEILRPTQFGLVDAMVAPDALGQRLEAVELQASSPVLGKSLREARRMANTPCVVVGMRARSETRFHFSPSPQSRLEVGAELLVLGKPGERRALRSFISGAGPGTGRRG